MIRHGTIKVRIERPEGTFGWWALDTALAVRPWCQPTSARYRAVLTTSAHCIYCIAYVSDAIIQNLETKHHCLRVAAAPGELAAYRQVFRAVP